VKKSKSITVASFSFADLAKGQIALVALGAVLACGGGLAAMVSAASAQASADAKGAARQLMGVSSLVIQGTQGYSTGASDKLAAAGTGFPALRAAMQELRASSQSLLVAPSLSQAGGQALAAFSALDNAASPLAAQISGASDVSASLGSSRGHLAEMIKGIKESGRSAQLGRAVESLSRLHAYADAGVGLASIPWVDYDLRIVAMDLAPTEFRPKLAAFSASAGSARSLAEKAPSAAQLAQLTDAATQARSAGERLGSTAAGVVSSTVLGGASLGLVITGLALCALGLFQIVGDFGRRFQRTMVQFRSEEASRDSMVAALRNTLERDGLAGEAGFSASVDHGSELGEISQLIGELVEKSTVQLRELRANVAEGQEGNEGTAALVESVRTIVSQMAYGLSNVSEKVGKIAERSRLLSLDASAAAYSASEATSRAADAVRVAQDGASRFDALREGLQETSKAVKRLGERTQEIDGVIDTLEQLSEQIGVLSVNASLEAERAGDAGAGFRTVAKEVQSIARRSGEALDTISSLIKGAQADARAAAESVDKSTGFVVAGTNVGAVSQALLGAVVPLTASTGFIAKTMADDGAKLSEELLGIREQQADIEYLQHRGSRAADDASTAVSAVRDCLSAVVGA
jgi:methyl-accepting chemotaxis protein